MNDEYTLFDLISFSHNQKPIEFEHAFNSLITDKLADAVSYAKANVAQTMFAHEEESEE